MADMPHILQCRTLLSRAYDSACNFMEGVDRCFQYGDLEEARKMAIIEKVKEKDFTQLNGYLAQMNDFLLQCDIPYNDFEILINGIIGMMIKQAASARVHSVVGALTGTAVAISIIITGPLGPLVLAIGSVLAGSAVAGGARATGAAATATGAAATLEARSVLRKMLDSSSRLGEDMHKVKEMLNKINDYQQCISSEDTASESVDMDTLVCMFEILLTSIKEGRKIFEKIERNVKDIEKLFNGMLKVTVARYKFALMCSR